MKTILIDPYPREMKLIFTKEKLNLIKKNFKLINVPKSNKHKFYKQYISKADFIIGQPDLPTDLIQKASKLKLVVKSNKKLPKGHPAEGEYAWLFVDEVLFL